MMRQANRAGPSQTTRKRGFSLLEVILAISVAGLILTAATALLVAMTTNWVLRDDRSFLEAHVGGVTQFLTDALAAGGLSAQAEVTGGNGGPPSAPSVGNGNGNGQNPGGPGPGAGGGRPSAATGAEGAPAWRTLPGASTYDDPLIGFTLAQRPALLMTELPVDQQIECYLKFTENEGLFMLWSSALQPERPERTDDLIRTQISPYLREVRYLHFDPRFERWEESTEYPREQDGTAILPRFLRLVFEKDGVELERIVPVPARSQGLPLY